MKMKIIMLPAVLSLTLLAFAGCSKHPSENNVPEGGSSATNTANQMMPGAVPPSPASTPPTMSADNTNNLTSTNVSGAGQPTATVTNQ